MSTSPAPKSTKISLLSMMNSDTPPPATPAGATVPKSDPKPATAKKSRARKLTPSLDLNTTIIIDGKPLIIPVPSKEPPKKKVKKDPAAPRKKPGPKPKAKQLLNKDDSKPATASPLPLSVAPKIIKRGPKPKEGSTPAPTLVPPPEKIPIKTLEVPKLATVTKSVKEPTQPLDPLAAKKTEPVVEEPIISLHIPLVGPNQPPGSLQVIFNVTKLCEDKYGWKALHPNAKFAMEELNEDDDMDDMEDDDELDEAERVKRELERQEEAKKEREEEKPKKRELSFEARMNRKIGKYDCEDPFIDDEELLWDEQQVSTKDGFFVYYGPLFEEGSNPKIEKLDSKSRNNNNSTNSNSANSKNMGNSSRGSNGRFNSTNSTSNTTNASSQPKSRANTPPLASS